MTLIEWFEKEEKRLGKRVFYAAFGRKIGLTGAGVKKILDGGLPKPKTMAAIEIATAGKVKPADFYQPTKGNNHATETS